MDHFDPDTDRLEMAISAFKIALLHIPDDPSIEAKIQEAERRLMDMATA